MCKVMEDMRDKSREEGREEGRIATIRQAVQSMQENFDQEQIISQIKLLFGLTDEEASFYMKS